MNSPAIGEGVDAQEVENDQRCHDQAGAVFRRQRAPQTRFQIVPRLRQVAFQHGSPEGPVELSAASEGSNVVLSVHNEGEPIPSEAMPTLFNPLVRHAAEKSTSPEDSGSIGLGLYIVREIVNATGGTIAVATTAQQGTTFTVRIPRQPAVEGISE